MSADELLRAIAFSPDPSSFRPRPSSDRTQDISHLLTSLFKSLYTGEVIGKDTGANLIRSKGGDDPHHQKFVEELQQIRSEYEQRMAEADMVEKHIIQARARTTAQEERVLSALKHEGGETSLGLPPVDSHFRWCVDSGVLRKLKLICPDDYITDPQPITKAPRDSSVPSFCKETFSFHQHISKSPVDDGYTELEMPNLVRSMDDVSLTSLSSSVSLEGELTKKKSRQKATRNNKPLKKGTSLEESELSQAEHRHSFLKNPRFLPPNSVPGGRSLLAPAKRREGSIQGIKHPTAEKDPFGEVPVFLANPPVVFFPDYEVGQIYEMAIELRNMTASSRHLRIIPPSTPYFSVGLGKFPGEGGIVAPGMSCHYTVRFVPDSLADFEDFLLVETQSPYPVLVPIEARRPPPVLTIPRTLNCGPCLIGGVKVLEYFLRNEGLSRGRFCIMPRRVWPPANFRSVATSGFVEDGPFGIRPAAFELYPGQGINMEIVFFPESPQTYSRVFTIACDNCQVREITLTGYGQQVGLELVSVSDGESPPSSGDSTDTMAGHLIHFQPTNLHSTVQKSLLIRNSTHVELPYCWQIMNPNVQTLLPGAPQDVCDLHTSLPFSLTPAQGILQPHQDSTFTVSYTPTEMSEHHRVAHMVLREIPEAPSAGKKPRGLTEFTPSVNDVIVLDLDLKGMAEAFQIQLEPYAIIFPGESYIGTTMRKQFKMWNKSKSAIVYRWEQITSCHVVQIEPSSGTIEPNKCSELEICLTGGKTGFCSQKVICHIEHSPETAALRVEATFKGPVVSIDIPSLDLGLLKLGSKSVSIFTIENKSPLQAKWSVKESPACLSEQNEQESQFLIEPNNGELLPLGQAKLALMFQPLTCQRLETVLEFQVENGEGSYLPVTADVQLPQVRLLSSTLAFSGIYMGVPGQSSIKMLNQGRLPARFCWGELTGSHSMQCAATITPANGTLAPNEEAEMNITLTSYTTDELYDIAFLCTVKDMKEPLTLRLMAKAQGLQITYSLCTEAGSSDESAPVDPRDLLLDFGSEVPLYNTVQRKLILTNQSAISAPFSLEAAYFCDFRRALLSDGKGAAFVPRPSCGTLEGFQQIAIEVTAYSNMWGEYSDELLCKVGDLTTKSIPMKMAVRGSPLYFQMTGPKPGLQMEGPVIRFGSQLSGGDTISRCLRINNPSPYDIRIDWETYNMEQSDPKLLDLVLLYGDPFPLKDIDGNEIYVKDLEQTEAAEQKDEEISPNRTTGTEEKNLISVILRPHEGVPSDFPYCITPRQMLVPAGGSSAIHVSFTPLNLSGATSKTECDGFALGFLSLDNEAATCVPGRVSRLQGYGVQPIRMELQACVKPSLLTIEMEDEDEGLVFYSVASNLIADMRAAQILTEFLTTQSLKLKNCTEMPLSFRLLVPKPFVASAADPNGSMKSSQNREAQEKDIVLHPQQNILVKVSFCTTLELLTYQNLPANQLQPGVQLLQSQDGEKKLHFTQQLVIEYSNNSTQHVPLEAHLSLPALTLSCQTLDFGTCFVGQPRTQEVRLMNSSGSKSYWTALLGRGKRQNDQEIFSISPTCGRLEAYGRHMSDSTEALLVSFTARASTEYEMTVTIHGMLGEQPLHLQIKGQGSYDEKFEVPEHS
uniref:Deleted in lung and esophageal cancer protein 1 n=1 Tax=Xenopus tropicalis TaxID=8364 RepID=A0A1B8YA02_XENTR